MRIKTIPLSRLEADPRGTLNECADEGQAFIVEMPDQRLIAIHALEPGADDSLIDKLLRSNDDFRKLIESSKLSPRKPFTAHADPA